MARTDARRPLAAATLIASAALALGAAGPAWAATSAQQVYEKGTATTPSPLPELPKEPVRQPLTTGPMAISEVRPLPIGIGAPILEDPAERAAAQGATLPVTGLDALVFFLASAVAAILGLALCVLGPRRT